MEKRGCGCGCSASTSSPPHRAPSSYALVFLGCVRVRTGRRGGEEGAGSAVYACVWGLPNPRPRTRARHRAIRRWRRCLSSTWMQRARTLRIWVHFWVWMSTRTQWRWGWGKRAGTLWVLPSPSTYARSSRSTKQVAKFG
ncbi:hypothetical protein B0H13DRAFT_2688354, partial [Mycena leptocephala]